MPLFVEPSAWHAYRQGSLGQKSAWLAEALGLAGIWLASSVLSPDRASTAGRWLMARMGSGRARTVKIKHNLRQAFPDRSEDQIESLARETWGNLGAVMAEYPHLDAIRGSHQPARLETVIKGDIKALQKPGTPAIFVTGHFGNWELAAAATVDQGVPLSAIHSEQSNPLTLSLIQRKRQQLGCGFVAKEAGVRPLIRLLEQGTSIGLLADVKIDSGEPIPFFGRDAITTVSPARLALKFNCELVPVQVERLHKAYFRVTFHPPIRPEDPAASRQTQILQMTRQLNAHYESWIRQRPGQWWCAGNRWPKIRPPE